MSYTSGTGDYSLDRSRGNFLRLRDVYTSGATVTYHVTDDSGQMEVNRGVFTAPNLLTRGTFLLSSTGSPIGWRAGGQVYVTPLIPALPLCDTSPTLHQVLEWDGTEWCPVTLTSGVAPMPPDDDTADMQDFDTGTTFTITLTKPVTQAVCRSTDAGVKTWNIPDPVLFDGYSLDIKTATNDGSTHNVVPAANTVGGLSGITFTDTNCNLFLRAKAADNDWIIRCLCCYTPTPFSPVACLPFIVYSNRKVVPGYAGALYTIRRSSDNTTMSFPPTGGGDAPVSAITTFLGGSNGTVTLWNDQSGNGFNAVSDIQPGIWDADPTWLPSQLGSVPALRFVDEVATRGLAVGLSARSITFPTASWTMFFVAKHEAYTDFSVYPNVNDVFYLIGMNNGGGDTGATLRVTIQPAPNPGPPTGAAVVIRSDDDTASIRRADFVQSPGVTGLMDNYSILEFAWDGTPAHTVMKADGVDMSPVTPNNFGGTGDFTVVGDMAIGGDTASTYKLNDFVGSIAEIIIYNCVLTSAERDARRVDIATYYGIALP